MAFRFRLDKQTIAIIIFGLLFLITVASSFMSNGRPRIVARESNH